MTRILLVDDEAAVLSGYARILHGEFEVTTAPGGETGLTALCNDGPFAVVVSDMRMPGMNGAQFLAKAKELKPDTTRMLLTGYTDLNVALQAVNQGNIFRFLTKPCPKDLFISAINSGVEQYDLLRSEKDLLENTLMGSIKVLAEILSAGSPEAFGRSLRIVKIVNHVAGKIVLKHGWQLEAAARLSQLGCVTLDTDILQRASVGMKLSLDDQARFDTHPQAAERLLAGIPRMEPVAWMIGQQLKRELPTAMPGPLKTAPNEVTTGARILRLAVAFDDLRLKPMSNDEAINRLRSRSDEFERHLVDSLVGVRLGTGHMEARRVSNARLGTGMILDQEIRNHQGMLMMAKGQEITRAVLMKLENFAASGLLDAEIMVMVEV